MTSFNWMKELANEKNNADFSELCHAYFKLATMRCMQVMRQKYNIPPNEIPTITLAIFARFLNEGAYAVGGAIKNGMSIYEILDKQQQLNLLRIFMNEPLDALKRKDIETELPKSLDRFKKFIMENANDFYVKD